MGPLLRKDELPEMDRLPRNKTYSAWSGTDALRLQRESDDHRPVRFGQPEDINQPIRRDLCAEGFGGHLLDLDALEVVAIQRDERPAQLLRQPIMLAVARPARTNLPAPRDTLVGAGAADREADGELLATRVAPGEEEALLDTLWAHATQPRFCYEHHWAAGDVVVWDNRATLHRRDAFDPACRRVLYAAQVEGHCPYEAPDALTRSPHPRFKSL